MNKWARWFKINADIYEHLHGINARLMDKVSAYRLGSILRAMGVTRHQHHDRRVYAVVPLKG